MKGYHFTTGELLVTTPEAAAAKVAAGLLHAELKRWDREQARGVLHDAAQRKALVELYQEMVRRSTPQPAPGGTP